jgi:hypothetical protein
MGVSERTERNGSLAIALRAWPGSSIVRVGRCVRLELCPARSGARSATWLRRQGVHCIERVMTDNGSANRSHTFFAALHTLGARHLR